MDTETAAIGDAGADERAAKNERRQAMAEVRRAKQKIDAAAGAQTYRLRAYQRARAAGCTNGEIAAIMGVSEEAVIQVITRARKAAEKAL